MTEPRPTVRPLGLWNLQRILELTRELPPVAVPIVEVKVKEETLEQTKARIAAILSRPRRV